MNFYKYELSKYRDKQNSNEWTSISDINKMYSGKKITSDMYLRVENNYINAINILMQQFSINELTIMNLEKYYEVETDPIINNNRSMFDFHFIETIKNIKEGNVYKERDLEEILRAVLREVFWCKLYSPKLHFIIDIGYDFYVNIICPKVNNDCIYKINNLGLYLRN